MKAPTVFSSFSGAAHAHGTAQPDSYKAQHPTCNLPYKVNTMCSYISYLRSKMMKNRFSWLVEPISRSCSGREIAAPVIKTSRRRRQDFCWWWFSNEDDVVYFLVCWNIEKVQKFFLSGSFLKSMFFLLYRHVPFELLVYIRSQWKRILKACDHILFCSVYVKIQCLPFHAHMHLFTSLQSCNEFQTVTLHEINEHFYMRVHESWWLFHRWFDVRSMLLPVSLCYFSCFLSFTTIFFTNLTFYSGSFIY